MTPKSNRELTSEELAAYLEGEVTASESHRIERLLEESYGARRRLATLQHIRDALVRPIPELTAVDLVATLRTAMGEPARVSDERKRPRWSSSIPWVAAAASVCVVIGLGTRLTSLATGTLASGNAPLGQPRASIDAPSADDEFRVKSGDSSSDPARWAGIQIYRLHRGGRPERVGKSLSRGDGLLFAYTNLGPAAFAYLMIFAVDARGKVRWFHPAYERQGDNPESIPIHKGEAGVPLSELIHHELALGSLTFHALFSSSPIGVLAVEAAVAGTPPGAMVALPNVVDERLTVQVEP